MSDRVQKLRNRLFARVPRDRDAYHATIATHLRPTAEVLDVGCGKGHLNPFPWSDYPGARIVGIDPDPEASQNSCIAEFHLLEDGKPWGMADRSADLVVCRYVLEHVEDPALFLSEVRRVLRPGGRFVFLTPSRYYPVMLVSHWLPHSLHQKILARTKKSAANDVFATFYRMNSKRDLRRLASENGFRIDTLVQRDFQPTDYFDFNIVAFLLNFAVYGLFKLIRLDRQLGASLLGVWIAPKTTSPVADTRGSPIESSTDIGGRAQRRHG